MSANTNLGSTPVNQGYVQLIHTGETGGISGTLRTLYDGDGTASDLQIASNAVKISTQLYIGSQTILEYIQEAVKDILVTNASHTNITATQDAGDKSIDLNASGEVTLTGTQTLTNKTLASPTFTGTANGANLTLTGDLTVSGDTIFTNSNTVLIGDAILTLNADETGSPTQNAGFEVERGTSTNKTFIWNETDDKWTIGSETFVAGTVEASLTGNVTGSASLNLLKSSNLSDLTNASTARTNLGVDPAGTDNSTDVTLAGSLDYITLSGQQITRNAIDLTTDVTGTLPVGNGGTGLTSISTLLNSNVTPSSLGLVIGTNVQAYDEELNDIASIDTSTLSGSDNDKFIAWSFSSAGFVLSSFPATQMSGSTNNGLLTYNSQSVASVESNLTFDGSNVLTATDGSESMAYTPSNNYLTIHETGATKGSHLRLATDNSDFILTAGGGTNQLSLYDVNGTANRLVVNSSGTFHFQHHVTLQPTKQLFFDGGGDTYIDEPSGDQLRLVAGGTEVLKGYSGGAIDMYGGSTTSRSINIGANRSGNGYSWIDLVGDATYTNYGVRFIRGNGGPNTSSEIAHRGTGVLALKAVDAGSVRFYTSNTERVRIDSSGNIGVGNIAPNEKLQINSNTTYDTKIRLGDNGTGRYFLAGMLDSNTGMIGYVNGSPSHLAFHTGTGATGSEKMRITTDGNVGIGLNNPDSPLHIANNVATSAGFDSFADYQILLYDTGTSSTSYGLGIRGNTMMFNSDNDYEWRHDNSAVMFLDGSAGRLGINNTSPAYALDVSGGGRFTGHVDFDSTITIDSVLYGSTINTSGELNFTGAGNKIIDIETLAGSNSLTIRHHNPTGNLFENALKLTANGSTELYYNNSKKFETTSTGAKITGTTNSDLFSLEGAGSSFKLIAESGDTSSVDVMAYRLGLRYGSNDNGFIDFYRGPDGATGYLAFGASGSEAMRLDRFGKLGIGTASPSKKFVVKGASGDQARFEHNGAVGAVDIYSGTDGGLINVRNASGTSIIELDGRTGNLELPYGRITDAGTDMNIVSDNALTLGTESGTALTIPNASTNVGIGVASPNHLLEIEGQTNDTEVVQISNDAGGSGSVTGITHLGITHFPGNTYSSTRITAIENGTASYTGHLAFSTRSANTDSAPAERMRITSAGSVGIGQSSPGYKLDVNGNGRFVADLRCEGRYLSQNGSQSAPSYSFNSQGNAGMFRIGTGIGLSAGGSTIVQVNADGRVNYNSLTGVDHITIRSNGHTNSSSSGTFYVKFCTIVVDNSPSHYNGVSLSGTLYRGDNASGNTIDWSVWFNNGLDSGQITHGGYMMSKGAVFIDNIFVQRTAGDGEIDNGSCTYELYYDLSQAWTNNIYNVATEVHYPSEGKFNVTWNSDQSEVTTLPGTQVVNVQTAIYDGTNQTKVPHGSASYPSYSFLGDMNTGIYRQASDTMSFSMGGTEKFRFESDGDFHTAQDVIAYSTTPSDRKLKDNIKDIKYGLDTIMQLSPKEYDWKKDNRHDIGFIAQEVEEVIPEIVKNKEWFDDKIKTLDYEKLTAVLIKAVQEQQEQINKLEEKLNG